MFPSLTRTPSQAAYAETAQREAEALLDRARLLRSQAAALQDEKASLLRQIDRLLDNAEHSRAHATDKEDLRANAHAAQEVLSGIHVEVDKYAGLDPQQIAAAKELDAQLEALSDEVGDCLEEGTEPLIPKIRAYINSASPDAVGPVDDKFQALLLSAAVPTQKVVRKRLQDLASRAEAVSAQLAELGEDECAARKQRAAERKAAMAAPAKLAQEAVPRAPIVSQPATPHLAPASTPAGAPTSAEVGAAMEVDGSGDDVRPRRPAGSLGGRLASTRAGNTGVGGPRTTAVAAVPPPAVPTASSRTATSSKKHAKRGAAARPATAAQARGSGFPAYVADDEDEDEEEGGAARRPAATTTAGSRRRVPVQTSGDEDEVEDLPSLEAQLHQQQQQQQQQQQGRPRLQRAGQLAAAKPAVVEPVTDVSGGLTSADEGTTSTGSDSAHIMMDDDWARHAAAAEAAQREYASQVARARARAEQYQEQRRRQQQAAAAAAVRRDRGGAGGGYEYARGWPGDGGLWGIPERQPLQYGGYGGHPSMTGSRSRGGVPGSSGLFGPFGGGWF